MIKLFDRVPIFHIASMARCGETLLLKLLSVHPKLYVVHNVKAEEKKEDLAFFEYLKKYSKTSISLFNCHVRRIKGIKNKLIIVKQGVWQHKYPFNGFVLIRNPLSVYASLKIYDVDELGDDYRKNWFRNKERLLRWMNYIDKKMISEIERSSPVEQFCLFYNVRFQALLERGLPIVYYEELVSCPERVLEQIQHYFDVDYDSHLINSHVNFQKDEIGHGKNDLSKPINVESIYKYRQYIDESEANEIISLTKSTYAKYGYKITFRKIMLKGKEY